MTRPSWQWTEDDLLEMKTRGAKESLYLEFKASGALDTKDTSKAEIGKDVSSFANSDGGDILYGVVEADKPPSTFDDIDGIDPSRVSPDWLEEVIDSRIQPRINGVRINPIKLSSKSCPGKFVYAVSIPASHNAPHQASDKRYYKRFNFRSVPMEDYEIRDVRNRRIEPTVVAEVLGKQRRPRSGWRQGLASLQLSIVLMNTGKKTAQQVYIECNIPRQYIDYGVTRIEGAGMEVLIGSMLHRQLRYHHRDSTGALPLFPATDHEVLDGNRQFVKLRLREDQARKSLEHFVSWVAYADGATPQDGSVSIGELFGL